MDYQIYQLFSNLSPVSLSILLAWSLVWKGLALWRSARLGQKNWFIALLLLNTVGILEIIYLFYLTKPEGEDEIVVEENNPSSK